MRFLREQTLKNDRKDTTIFFNRCTFIEKLTPHPLKKIGLRRQKGKNDGKNFGFSRFWMTKCRFFCQNGGKFPCYSLLLYKGLFKHIIKEIVQRF